MIGRTQDRFGTWPEKLVADAAYGSAENLAWLVHERGIEPHIPVFDKSRRRDGTFSRSDFAYDHDRDLYICPDGKELGSSAGPSRCRATASILKASCATGRSSATATPVP